MEATRRSDTSFIVTDEVNRIHFLTEARDFDGNLPRFMFGTEEKIFRKKNIKKKEKKKKKKKTLVKI